MLLQSAMKTLSLAIFNLLAITEAFSLFLPAIPHFRAVLEYFLLIYSLTSWPVKPVAPQIIKSSCFVFDIFKFIDLFFRN